jgi:hypothetical protein
MERGEIDISDTLRVVFSVLSAGLKILSNLIHKLPILVYEDNYLLISDSISPNNASYVLI